MKKPIPLLLLAVLVAGTALAQSGRKVARPTTQPLPPVQAPVFSQPDPEPESEATTDLAALRKLPDSLLERPLKSLDNSSFRMADFSGKVLVVNVWASWCPPCRREVPEYERVRSEYVGRAVEFIGLTIENPRTSTARVKEFVRKLSFGFRVGWADAQTARTLMNGNEAIPQTLVIDPDGRILSHWDGYAVQHSGDHLRSVLENALSKAEGNEGR